MDRLNVALAGLLIVGCTGCTRAAGGAVTFAPDDPWASLPVDTSITPISRADPSDRAKLALEACGIIVVDPDHPKMMMNLGIDVVSSMGLVEHAFDAYKIAPLGSPLAEVDRDEPIWVINTHGVINLTLGPTVRNATCIVYDGSWYDGVWVGGDELEDGAVVSVSDPQPPPVRHLPPLAP